MSGPADYRIAILPYPPGQGAGYLPGYDITDDCTIDDCGSINRAVEGDFLNFRTGDLTLGAINDDGKFDDLFGNLGPTDRWQLHVFRRGRCIFLGIILGQGSINFNKKSRMVEITAYGATKLLDETSAETVSRAIAAMTVTTATAGQAQITLNSTAGLLSGDVLHVTDQVNAEDVTVKQVTSGTVATLETTLGNSYVSTSPVTLSTQFYRYKTPDYLVRALFAAANVPIAELKIDNSLFDRLAPTPVNISGFDLTKAPHSAPAGLIDGKRYETLGGGSSYSQSAPDSDWAVYDATDRPWIDPTRYFMQGQAPPIDLRSIITGQPANNTTRWQDAMACGYDYTASPYRAYYLIGNGVNTELRYKTTADGVTWGGETTVATIVAGGGFGASFGVEFDPTRGIAYCACKDSLGNYFFKARDIGGATTTDLKQGDDAAGSGYYTPTYIPELDLILAMRGAGEGSGTLQIAAYRGTARLWVRDLPTQPADTTVLGASGFLHTLAQSCRYFDGAIYALVATDGHIQLLRTDDQFRTYTLGKMFALDVAFGRNFWASRIGDKYAISCASGATFRGYSLAGPGYSGVVSYADFTGKTVAEALQMLAILVNATFWVDDDFQGHFVARDQVPAGETYDLTQLDLLLEQGEVQLWDQARQYVEVSGGGVTATSGDARFASDKISVSSDLIPNEAYGQALADNYQGFYSKQRAMLPVSVVDDEDTAELFPMRRVMVDGRRLYIHESDHDPMKDEWTLKLLEDLENQPAT